MLNLKKNAGSVLVAIVIGIAGAFVSSNKNNRLSQGEKSATDQAGKRQFKYDKTFLDLLLGKVFLYELYLTQNAHKYKEIGVPSLASRYGREQKDFKSLTGNLEQRVKECLLYQEFLSNLDPTQSMSATDHTVYNIRLEQSRCEDQFTRINGKVSSFLAGKENFQFLALVLNQRGLPGAIVVQTIQEEHKLRGQGKPCRTYGFKNP
jgi:hypothetical protein